MTSTIIGFASIGLVLLAQLVAGIWWAATITERLHQLGITLTAIAKNEVENEKTHKTLWCRQDDLRDRMTAIEVRCKGNHRE